MIGGRHLLHGKLSLEADNVEVTTLLDRSPAALGASLRLLLSKTKVRRGRLYILDTHVGADRFECTGSHKTRLPKDRIVRFLPNNERLPRDFRANQTKNAQGFRNLGFE